MMLDLLRVDETVQAERVELEAQTAVMSLKARQHVRDKERQRSLRRGSDRVRHPEWGLEP